MYSCCGCTLRVTKTFTCRYENRGLKAIMDMRGADETKQEGGKVNVQCSKMLKVGQWEERRLSRNKKVSNRT